MNLRIRSSSPGKCHKFIMDLTIQHINWVGNIYQKFEAVCQDVDDIVGQDAVKYLENHVQNVGDSVKKFYSGVVHELLPFPTLASSKYDDHSVALTNNIGFSVESTSGCKDNNKKKDGENSVNNFIKALQDSNAIDIANNQQAGVPIKHNLVNQVSDETCSDSLDVEDSCITQEDVGDDSRETSGAKKENLCTIIEEVAVESVPKPMNLISVREKEPLELPIHCESYSDSSDSGCEVSIGTNDSLDANAGQNSCLIVVEENAMNSSTSEVSSFQSLDEEESIKVSLFSESSDFVDEDTHGILAEVSPEDSVSSERPVTMTEPLCLKSSLISDSLYSKSLGSYSFEITSCKKNSGDATLCISDSSMVHLCCESSPHVAGQAMESQDGLVFSSYCQSVESNDKSLVSSIESSLEDIQLNDPKLEESCVYVEESELYAVSSRTQKLKSYKKRIQDAFASKKRLAKEYEQLAIWYGDADIEPSQGFSQTLFPFSSGTDMDSKNMQMQHAYETEWELL